MPAQRRPFNLLRTVDVFGAMLPAKMMSSPISFVGRYSAWMTDAKRRNEDDWHESLENELVRSLSRPFYDSYAKGNCSGSVAGKASRTAQVDCIHAVLVAAVDAMSMLAAEFIFLLQRFQTVVTYGTFSEESGAFTAAPVLVFPPRLHNHRP